MQSIMQKRVGLILCVSLWAAGCGSSDSPGDTSLKCGAGTSREGDVCVAGSGSLTCGEGTHDEKGVCLPDSTGGVTCGAGTKEAGGACVADEAAVCGPGTTWSGSQCLEESSADPSLVALSALSEPTASFFDADYSTQSNNLHNYRFVVTDLTQGTADGWTEVQTPLIGTGGAVHVKWFHNTSQPVGTTPKTISVEDATNNDGGCLSNLTPETMPFDDIDNAYVNFFAWSGVKATAKVCGVGGAVTLVREATDLGRVKVTVNVQFSDGSSWVDKVFYADYRAE